MTEITPFYETKGKILSDIGDMDSELMHIYRKYLDAFDDFSVIDTRKEFDILESILNSTATLLKDFEYNQHPKRMCTNLSKTSVKRHFLTIKIVAIINFSKQPNVIIRTY